MTSTAGTAAHRNTLRNEKPNHDMSTAATTGAEHRARVIHRAVKAVRAAPLLRGDGVGDERIARGGAQSFPDAIREAQCEDHRP
jgi:hypothetical protein